MLPCALQVPNRAKSARKSWSRVPEEGLEPTRPCGQRILSAADNVSRVALVSRLYLFFGNGAWWLVQDFGDEAYSPNNSSNSWGARHSRRHATCRMGWRAGITEQAAARFGRVASKPTVGVEFESHLRGGDTRLGPMYLVLCETRYPSRLTSRRRVMPSLRAIARRGPSGSAGSASHSPLASGLGRHRCG